MFEKLADNLRKKTQEQEEIRFRKFNETTSVVNPDETKKEEEVMEKNATSVSADAFGAQGNIELKVVRPESFAEVSQVADYLLDGCTVVLNVEVLDKPATLRMLDFLNGVTYCLDGEIKKVAQSTYILTPRNVDVSDDK
ncbi:MAG: cell division protein SepF [Clostridia bacterium]|nr:cell division protein SepF [Clostridia bacterium]